MKYGKRRALAVLGTATDVGKTTMVAGFCRILANRGFDVAPFKAQNMAAASTVLADGSVVSSAQVLQADASRLPCTVDMNPVVLLPVNDTRSRVFLRGQIAQEEEAAVWMRRVPERFGLVADSLDRLLMQHEVVVLEGAGSAAEVNLWETDIVNWRPARHANADVVLVGDISIGGVFAQLLGTLDLLSTIDRARVKGLIVNKFRGDVSLFHDGIRILEERSGLPVLGVVPQLENLRFDEKRRDADLDRLAEHLRTHVSLETLETFA